MKSAVLPFLIVVFLAPAALASPTHERTFSYYGFVYGQNGNYCSCQVGPCVPDLLGEKMIGCNGAVVYSWGITTGTCFTSVVEETSPCGSGAVAATAPSGDDVEDAGARQRAEACAVEE